MVFELLDLACLPLPHAWLTYASSGKAVHDDPTRHVRQVEVEAVLREACGIKIKVAVTVADTAVVAVRPQHHPQVGRAARVSDAKTWDQMKNLTPAGSKKELNDSKRPSANVRQRRRLYSCCSYNFNLSILIYTW